MATNDEMPRNSGTPAATAAPNASSRMISVPADRDLLDFASSARSCGASAFCRDAAPCSLDAQLGMRLLDGGDGGQRRVGDRLELLEVLPWSRSWPASRRSRARSGRPWRRCSRAARRERALDVLTPLICSRRLTTSLHRGGDLRIVGLDRALALDEHALADSSGKPASSTIMAPRLESPLPDAESFSWFCPTLPPIRVARTTNAIQPRMAVFRCVALQRPARAARFLGCKFVVSGGRGRALRRTLPSGRGRHRAAFRRPERGDSVGSGEGWPPDPGGCPHRRRGEFYARRYVETASTRRCPAAPAGSSSLVKMLERGAPPRAR